MKNFSKSSLAAMLVVSAFAMAAPAQAQEAPEAKIIVPIGGVQELSGNMVDVTWGYYTLKNNAENGEMMCTITLPTGEKKELAGSIQDANGEEIGDPDADNKPQQDNAFMVRGFLKFDWDTMVLEQIPGTFTINIPANTVLIDINSVGPKSTATEPPLWVPNDEVTLTWYVIGKASPDTPDTPGPGSGISTVSSESDALYFDMNGQQVKDPEKGIFIKVSNGETSKIVK